jgi:hypothetical protein
MINLHVCPECASAKVELGDLVGDEMEATCSNCGWKGKHKDLIGAGAKENQIVQGAMSIDDPSVALAIAKEVSVSYMRLLAKHAGQAIGLAMVQSGMVGAKDPQSLTRLIKAACGGAHKATLEEVENIQKELQDAKRSNAS